MTERHESPDGVLALLVFREDEDITIGIEGYTWHTHGDVLAAEYRLKGVPGFDPEQAARRFVADVTQSRAVLAIERQGAVIKDIWVTDDPSKDLQYKPDDTDIEFRYWDGTRCQLVPWN